MALQLPEQTGQNLEAALSYLTLGFSVIPVGRNKKPLVKWEQFQQRRATVDEINGWFTQFKEANIGIVTGAISGIVVVDVEVGGSTGNLPPTVMSKTGGGGWHFYYKHPGQTVKNSVRISDKTDIRGDGGYVVAPPSIHKTGNRYEWVITPEMADFAELPHWVLGKMQGKEAKDVDWKKFIGQENLEGTRNLTTAQLAGKLLYHLPQELWELTGWSTMQVWNNTNNNPPLAEQELRATWESIKKAEGERRMNGDLSSENTGRKSQSALLLKLIENKGVTHFCNELREPFVVLPIENHREIWYCRSRMFKRWLAKEFWDDHSQAINSDALNTALNVIEGKACFAGEKYDLATRVAWFGGAVWYDLANPNWEAIKIGPEGWSVTKNPPILFRRYTHQQAQVAPLTGGDVQKFCEFINIKDEGQKLLLLVYLISCFIPGFPHPVLSVYGAQGSAKSMLCKFMRKLIDPSSIEVSGFPKDTNELAQLLAHHWCIFFDNISALPGWISDMLCKAVSGDGFSKRELFSDDDDVIYTFKRCIGINGINLVVSKPDLLERSILLELERVPQGQRKQEKELLEEFERQRPNILGGIFDVIAKTLKIRPTITLPELPRMADFAVWGCAIAEALGHTQQEFLKAYNDNISSQNEQVLGESLIAVSVRAMLKNQSEWEGTPSELLKELTVFATGLGINTIQERDWPKAANTLSRRLNELKTNLEVDGIKFRRFEKDKKRVISLQKEDENTVATVESFNPLTVEAKDGNDSSDDTAIQPSLLSSPEITSAMPVDGSGDDGDDTIPNPLA